jgi:hypothetical protein
MTGHSSTTSTGTTGAGTTIAHSTAGVDGPTGRADTAYEIRVAGLLDDHWTAWLGALTLVRNDDGTTALTGSMADQAQLHGVLAAIRDLGVTLLSVRTLDHAALADHVASATAPSSATSCCASTTRGPRAR